MDISKQKMKRKNDSTLKGLKLFAFLFGWRWQVNCLSLEKDAKSDDKQPNPFPCKSHVINT